MLLVALSLAMASDWTLYDTTDNLTGERSISAIALAENYAVIDSPSMFLHCYKTGGPRFDLFASNSNAPKYLPRKETFGSGLKPVYISFVSSTGVRQAAPIFWRASGNSLVYEGAEMETLVADASASDFIEVSILTDSGKVSARYATEGLKRAYDYMVANCDKVTDPH